MASSATEEAPSGAVSAEDWPRQTKRSTPSSTTSRIHAATEPKGDWIEGPAEGCWENQSRGTLAVGGAVCTTCECGFGPPSTRWPGTKCCASCRRTTCWQTHLSTRGQLAGDTSCQNYQEIGSRPPCEAGLGRSGSPMALPACGAPAHQLCGGGALGGTTGCRCQRSEILTPLVSTTTSAATQALLHKGAQNAGPIWPPQVTGLLEVAANALRAVAALDPLGHNRAPIVGGGVPSVPAPTQMVGGQHARRQPPGLDGGIFPGAMLTSGPPTMVTESRRVQPLPVSENRWTKRSQPLLEEDRRPVKSPRLTSTGTGTQGQADTAMASTQDHGPLAGAPEAVPWPQDSTGRTPTRSSRPTSSWMTPAHSAPVELDGSDGFSEPISFLGGEEMEAPLSAVEEDWQQWQLSWITAWNTSVGQLMDMCGAAATAAQSNPALQEVLPEPPHMDTDEVRNQCQSTLRSLQQHPWACGPEIATAVEDLMRCYSCLKSCPAAVPDCPQAVLLIGHILHAAVQDVMSYTPQCTEEWLFPQLVLGKHPDLAARLGASTPALPHHALLQTCACPFLPA